MSGALVANVLAFGRALRAAGLSVHHGRLVDALRALDLVGLRSRADLHATLRGLLVHRHDDLARFDAAFEAFFRAAPEPAPGLPLFSLGERPRVVVRTPPAAPVSVSVDELHRDASPTTTRAVAAWSDAHVSRTKDFADFTPEELERAAHLLARLPWRLGVRTTRRWRAARGGAIDLRRTLGRSARAGGDLFDLPRRKRLDAARPIVMLGDVSGSMERYSRVLIHFVYGLAQCGARVETFLFATRLTRVTRHLARPGPGGRGRVGTNGAALVVRQVQDWGGGTRIGEALHTFNTAWARRVMRNGPAVLIVSDGWDRGDPALLAQEAARLRRSCHRLIWLNPLLGSPNYEPLTRGMQAALGYVDDFLPAHNVASLEQLVDHLRALPPRRRALGRRPERRAQG